MKYSLYLLNLRPMVQNKWELVANLIFDSILGLSLLVEIDQPIGWPLTFGYVLHRLFEPKRPSTLIKKTQLI